MRPPLEPASMPVTNVSVAPVLSMAETRPTRHGSTMVSESGARTAAW